MPAISAFNTNNSLIKAPIAGITTVIIVVPKDAIPETIALQLNATTVANKPTNAPLNKFEAVVFSLKN